MVVALSRDLFNLLKKGEKIKEIERKVEELILKKKELEERLEYVKSEEFVEKEARDKLNMAKEDEVIMVLPEGFKTPNLVNSKTPNEDLANWQRWLRLFFWANSVKMFLCAGGR